MLEHIPVALRDLILGCSGLAAGLAGYLAWVHVAERRPWWWAWFCARAGFAIVVLVIAEAVFRQPAVPWSWRAGLYIGGLLMASVGFFGIALETRHRRRGQLRSRNGDGR